jgi:hypothetical protein
VVGVTVIVVVTAFLALTVLVPDTTVEVAMAGVTVAVWVSVLVDVVTV